MKILERDEDGNLKTIPVDIESRILAEQVKKGELSIEEIPDIYRDEVETLI